VKQRKPKTTNWGDYKEKLERRGSLNLWIDEDLISDLNGGRVHLPVGGNGGPFDFPDVVIELLLMIRTVYKMPLRQTVGFSKSLFPHIGVEKLGLPHFSTLSRRAHKLEISLDPIA
jgi:hypothetical protein